MEGRREVSIISNRPGTSCYLKQERSFCRRNISKCFQLLEAWVAGAKREGGEGREKSAKGSPIFSSQSTSLFPFLLIPFPYPFRRLLRRLFNSLILRRSRLLANDLGPLRIRLAIKSTSEEMILSIRRSKRSLMPFWTDALNTRPHCQLVTSNFIFLCVRKRK